MIRPPVSIMMRDRQRELLDAAERLPYKQLDSGETLDLYVFAPGEPVAAGAAAIVFFYGGGMWEQGVLSQFGPQCAHFSKRGMVAVLADYRCGQARGATPVDGLEDVHAAIDWIHGHASQLGIDRSKLVLAGASSGAQAALAAVMESGRAAEMAPAAMVLFSPIVNVARAGVAGRFAGGRLGVKQLSPLHQVRKGLPPMLVFHATQDRVQPVAEVEAFARKMARKRNRCDLNVFCGEQPSFFNLNVNAGLYEATLNQADEFLVSLGLLPDGQEGAVTTWLDSWY